MPVNPVPQDYDRTALRREVNQAIQRFQSGASVTQLVRGGTKKQGSDGNLRSSIGSLARGHEAIYSIRGDGRLRVGETAAVCYVGREQVILLRIFYRTARDGWYQFEYALCFSSGSRSTLVWENSAEVYRSLGRQQAGATDPTLDMALVRSTAAEVVSDLAEGVREFRPRSAQLDTRTIASQIKSLKPVFGVGVEDIEAAGVGAYAGVCFTSQARGFCLRVYRLNHDGWLYATFALDTRRRRQEVQYVWKTVWS